MVPSSLRRFFVLAHILAALVATVSAIINSFIGPFNLFLWFIPPIICVSGYVSLVIADHATTEAEAILAADNESLFRRTMYFLKCVSSRIYLTAAPMMWLSLAILLLVLSIIGSSQLGYTDLADGRVSPAQFPHG